MVADGRHGNLPAFDGVTRFAVCAELAAVNVRMAVRAFLSGVRKDQLHVALGALHFLVHAAQRVACLVMVKLRNAADRLPAQRGVTVLAGNVEGSVRIACSGFLRRTLWPLSISRERKEKRDEIEKSSTEHGTTSVDTPIASIGLGRVEFRISANTGTNNCTEGQFRGMFSGVYRNRLNSD